MRSKIRKNLVSTFQKAFEKRHPQFVLSKQSESSFKIWEWGLAPNLHFFVVLQPFEREDIFVLEIAWSEDDIFPWACLGDEFRVDKPHWRDRLGRLWQPYGKSPVWDLTPELTEARQAWIDGLREYEDIDSATLPEVDIVLPRIAPLVEDCLQKFREYGMPVFEQVAQHRGLSTVLNLNE